MRGKKLREDGRERSRAIGKLYEGKYSGRGDGENGKPLPPRDSVYVCVAGR